MKNSLNVSTIASLAYASDNGLPALRKAVITFLICVSSVFCFAQGYFVPTNNELGCRDKNLNGFLNINNQRIYLQTYSGTIFNASSGVNYSEWNLDEVRPLNACFSFVVTSVNGCTIRKIVAGVTTNAAGDYGYFTNTIKCPLDDYIWLLILPLSIFGFYIMRKINLLNLT